jgi:NAD(P)-dependent dehydrogenase (short-subunit alcohol dehydrogenase family)
MENIKNELPRTEYDMVPRPIFDNPNYIGTGKLNNKVTIITGGDSGIGRAIALLFAREGSNIVISYLNEHIDAIETKHYIEELGRKCLLISGDIRDSNVIKHIVEDTMDVFGKIDILINNAGVGYMQNSIEDVSLEQLKETFEVNIFSYFNLIKEALPYLKEESTIVNTASSSAFIGMENIIDYSASKGAVVSFTKALARLLIRRGIRVNAVAPGFTWTPLVYSIPSEEMREIERNTPIKRIAQPVEIAPAYLYLASGESSYVVGQILHVDGGTTICS